MTSNFAAFAAFTKAQMLLIGQKIATDIQARAQQNIRDMGAVDTGFMLGSGEVRVEGDTIIVIFNAEYSGFVHEGTRYVGARPFLRKAVEDVRGSLPSGVGLDVRVGSMSV